MKSAVLALLVVMQDKPVGWPQVIDKMNKVKTYNFTMKGGPAEVEGTFEKGSVYYKSGTVEVAGKGDISHASDGGSWTTVSMLAHQKKGGDVLPRLSKMIPGVKMLEAIVQHAKKMDGDSHKGFTGEFAQGIIVKLVRLPWLETEDLKAASKLEGSFAFSCAEGRVVKAEVQFKGNKIEFEKRHYQGPLQPGQPPPTPPGPTWKLNNDGYWYEGIEKPVAVNIVIEFKDFGDAKIPDGARKPIGLK